jgi:hypothetical protein
MRPECRTIFGMCLLLLLSLATIADACVPSCPYCQHWDAQKGYCVMNGNCDDNGDCCCGCGSCVNCNCASCTLPCCEGTCWWCWERDGCSCNCNQPVVGCFYPDCCVCVGQNYQFSVGVGLHSNCCNYCVIWYAPGGDPEYQLPPQNNGCTFMTHWDTPGVKTVYAITSCDYDQIEVTVKPLCGTGCCGANQYCCGSSSDNPVCCDANKVCCWGFDGMGGIYYYCNPPCRSEVTDTTSCSKDNEATHNECHGCQQLIPLTCSGTYRDYTGLQIKTCYDGCPQFDWNTSTKDCYKIKRCHAQMHEKSLCHMCNGEKICDPIVTLNEIDCSTLGECVEVVLCSLIETCYQCEKGDEERETVTIETCSCR